MSESEDYLLELTTEIIAAHLSNNKVDQKDIPGLMKTIYKTCADLKEGQTAQALRQDPAVPIEESITPDYLICLEDGKRLKMLKRHLKTAYDMTPADYREKWGLAPDYPMVAPNYAKKRSRLAKDIGLGTKNNG